MLKLLSSLFSYLKKEKKFQVISKFLLSDSNKRKRIKVLSGILFLFLIVILFSVTETLDSNESVEEKTSEQIKEKNNYTPENFSKNNEAEIKKVENKQVVKEKLSKSTKPLEKKAPIKNKLETPQKNKVEQLKKIPSTKNKVKKSDTPKEVVNNLHIGLKKVSEKISDSPNDLLNLVKNTYNAEKMIAKIVGDTWKKTSKKDQEEIVIIFEEYIAKNYFNRFKKIKNPTFNYKESKKITEKFILVKTDLVVNKEEVSINYLLLFDKNKWRIFDVLLAGSISEIVTKKSEFSGFLRDGKITPLIDALKKQNLVLDD
ncbi:MAG: hypothetical protein CMM98_03145 [Rickettsiales bacterium]|nr:hypothetical protein [Rickettsiales bacterium]